MSRALIWVQHLLGTGHTVRAAALAHALKSRGAHVTLVLGAPAPPTLDLTGLTIVELEPVLATDGSFTAIKTADRRDYESIAENRTIRLLDLVNTLRPDIVLTETFPFGRRRFAAEVLPMVDAAAAAGAVIASSIRDVLVRKSPEKEAQMAARAKAHYQHVLVHADPAFIQLGESFEAADAIASLIRYTGFVDGGATVDPSPHRKGIVVSVGGSGVGAAILEASVAAASGITEPMHILVPRPLLDLGEELAKKAPNHVTIEPNRPDFRALLSKAALSVSQAGYNTVLDVLAARPRALLIPFAAHEESEQTDRAAALARRGLAHVLTEDDLTAEILKDAVRTALAAPSPPHIELDTDGAQHAASILLGEAP